jgi:glycerol-3-phosphate acyltransferase PlsY
VLIGIDGTMAALVALVWLSVAFVGRYSSLAAIAAACVAPTLAVQQFGIGAISSAVVFMCLLLLWRHRSNITNLAAGTEGRIGRK